MANRKSVSILSRARFTEMPPAQPPQTTAASEAAPNLPLSRGLVKYPVSAPPPEDDTDDIPHYQRHIARQDGREDEEYYRDVENLTRKQQSSGDDWRTDPLGFMIRLTAESTAFYQGTSALLTLMAGSGWRAYEGYVGARILYPDYTDNMRKLVMTSDRVRACLDRLAHQAALKELGPAVVRNDPQAFRRLVNRLRTQQERQARLHVDGLIADMSNKSMVRMSAFIVNNILVRMYNQGIHIKESEFLEVRKVALEAEKKKQSLIFLPCHKSHVDYLVISYIFYRLGIALPHIAAGDNLNLPIVGWLLKHGGAFFIRRSFGNDHLYQEIVREYLELLLVHGHNIEVFVEGTRSRIGKLLAPRFGILKVVLDALLSGRIEDCHIVPMSIGYDKVIETETYVNELLGSPKEKESLFQLLNAASTLKLKLGRIDIRFAKPFSLRQWFQDQQARRTTPTSLFSPMFNAAHKATLLQALGYTVLADINSVSVIMPSALVGTILLTLRGRGVGREELIRRVTWLRREILLKGGRVADFGGISTASIVDRSVGAMQGLIGVRRDLLEPVFYALKRFELSLYRNQVMHLFINEAIVSAAMYATIKKGQTHRRIAFPKLIEDVKFLSNLLKTEFIFRMGSVEDNTAHTLFMLREHGMLDIELEDGTPVLDEPSSSSQPDDIMDDETPRSPDSGNATQDDTIDDDPSANAATPIDRQHYYIKLSDRERSRGRETFDFYCFLIWPFIETYWLAAAGLFSMLPTPKIGGITERIMMDRVQQFGKTLYYEGTSSSLF